MKSALVIAALLGATFLAYENTLHGQFLYDDKAIIVGNPLIRQLKNLPLILGTSYWGTSISAPQEAKGGLYRPLTVTSFAINYWAGRLNPFGYHLVNVLFHAGVAILLGILVLRLGLSRRAAAAASLLFAVLPVHAEAVSSVVGRSEILAAFFMLAAWIMAMDKQRGVAMGLGAAFFALALASKENAAVLVPVLILSDFVVSEKAWRGVLRERGLVWIVLIGTFGLYLEWKYLMLGSIASAGGIPYFDRPHAWTNVLTIARFTLAHYLKPLAFGVGFCADFTRPVIPDSTLADPVAWSSMLTLAALIGFSIWRSVRYKDRLALCILLFFLFLAPVSNLLVQLEVIGAERFLYLPSIGYCLALGILYERADRSSRMWATAGLFILSLWYAAATIHRNRIWQSEEAFWTATLRDAPKSARAWNGAGSNLIDRKMYDDAIRYFEQGLALNPLLVDARYNIALCQFLQHRYAQAKAGFLEVLRESPYDINALLHLSAVYEKERQYKLAAKTYAAILEIDPLNRPAKRNLAILHCRAGERDVCRAELNAFLREAPPEEPDDDLREYLKGLGGT